MRVIALSSAMLRDWVRSRSGVFFSFLFPIMLLLIFATIFGGQQSAKFTLYVQNLDLAGNGTPTNLSAAFIDSMRESNAFYIHRVPPEVDARSYVKENIGMFDPFRLLVIPHGFQDTILGSSLRSRLEVVGSTLEQFLEGGSGEIPEGQAPLVRLWLARLRQSIDQMNYTTVALLYVYDPGNSGSLVVKSILDDFARTFSYQVMGVEPALETTTETVEQRSFRAIDYYTPSIIAAFIMTNGIIGVTTNVTEFKRRGILKRLATTPLRKIEWIVGNMIAQTILSLMLVAAILLIGWVVFGLSVFPGPLSLALILAGAALFSGIGIFLSGLVTDVEAASAAGNSIAFPMMFLSGTFIPLETMPSYLAAIAKFLPLTYLSEGLRSSLIYDNPATAVVDLVIVAALALVFVVAGAKTTRWHE